MDEPDEAQSMDGSVANAESAEGPDHKAASKPPTRSTMARARTTEAQLRDLTRVANRVQGTQAKRVAEIARVAGGLDSKRLAEIAGTRRIADQFVMQNSAMMKQIMQTAELIRAGQLEAIRAVVPDYRAWLDGITAAHEQAISQALKGWNAESLAKLTRLHGIVPASILQPATLEAFRQVMGDPRLADAVAGSFAAQVAGDAQAAGLHEMGFATVGSRDKALPSELSDALESVGIREAPESLEAFVDLADIDNEAALDAARPAWGDEFEQSLDAATDAIVAESPWLSREKVRLGIKVFVLIVWVTGYTALAFVPGLTGPVLMGLIGAMVAAPTIADATEQHVLPKWENPTD